MYVLVMIDHGHVVFDLSVLFVCLSKSKNFNIGHNFLMVRDRAFGYQRCNSFGKSFSFVPKSSVKVNVRYHKSHKIWPLRGHKCFTKTPYSLLYHITNGIRIIFALLESSTHVQEKKVYKSDLYTNIQN